MAAAADEASRECLDSETADGGTIPKYLPAEHFTNQNAAQAAYVLSGFFFAAGNNTLFRISRYPGDVG
jgi:hypothetical protein